jgi:hypothetical protein
MNTPKVIFHIARADFLERVRRYSFLVTLMFALYLGYAAATGVISIRLGDSRGVYTSAWIGTLMAVVTTTFAGIAGFYIVKNAIDRDRVTRVGEILAATPIRKRTYALGKFLSNFAVLESMVAVLALAAVAMKLIIREDPQFNLWALWSPFIFLATPSMAIVAAIAVLFESVSWLGGGFGNVAYFFLWTFGFSTIAFAKSCWLDPFGVITVFTSMTPAAAAAIPGYRNNDFSITIETSPVKLVPSFRWQGIPWTSELVLSRVTWFGIAILIAMLAAVFFDRFDSAVIEAPKKKRIQTIEDSESPANIARPQSAGAVHLTPLDSSAGGFNFFHMLIAELRLALHGISWWWYLVAMGLVVGQLASPLEISRGPLLGVAWLWPVLIWSVMGVRESRNGTQQFIFSAARILPRQLPACWMAGVVIAMATGSGAAIRLMLAGEIWGVAAWAAGALFIPTFALALGVWSGSSRPFEALYAMLWYVGPLNRVPGFDFTGGADGALVARYTCVYFMIAAGMLIAAFSGRARQLRAG